MISDNDRVIETFMAFQATGDGFETAWEGVGPIVTDFARRFLRKRGVKVWTNNGEWAVDDVVSQAKGRLLKLGRPGSRGHFDPAKAKAPGLSGFKGWMWKVVYSQTIDWIKKNLNTGRKKLVFESDRELNDASGDGESESVIKRQPAKIERPALLPVLEELIGELPDTIMRDAMRLKLHEGLSEKATGKRLGVSDATVYRRLHKAYAILRVKLEACGIDGDWLAL